MTYNRIQTVRDRLDLSKEVKRHEELQEELERANRKVRSKVGKHLVDRSIVTDTDENTLNLRFDDIKEVVKIRRNRDNMDTSNYSTDKTTGVVTISGVDLGYRDLIEVHYIPRMFEDLELLYTEYYLLMHRNIVGEGEVRTARVKEIKEQIKELVNEINQTPGVMGLTTHYEGGSVW